MRVQVRREVPHGVGEKERAARVKVEDKKQRAEILKSHTAADKYWKDLLDRANAE